MSKKIKIILAVLGVFIAGILIFLNRERFPELLQAAFEWVKRRGPMAPVYFVLVYTFATFLFVPIAFVNMAGGFLFGAVPGAFIVAFAALFASFAGYLTSHYFLRNWVRCQIERNSSLQVVDKVIKSSGWKIVLFTRLAPVCPFIPLNFAYGVSKIKWWNFLLGSFIGFLPGAFLYSYFGAAAGAWIGIRSNTMTLPGEKFLLGLSAALAILGTVYMTKIVRRILAAGV